MGLGDGKISEKSLQTLWQKFHETHSVEYGKAFPESPIEVVNLRVSAIGQPKEMIFSPFKADGDLKNALVQTRDAVFRLDGSLQNFKTQIYRRNMLPINVEILGPAILLQKDSTTVVPPNATAKVHSTGNIIISLEPNS